MIEYRQGKISSERASVEVKKEVTVGPVETEKTKEISGSNPEKIPPLEPEIRPENLVLNKPEESFAEPKNDTPVQPTSNETPLESQTETQTKMKKIKFIHPVPSFVWTDLKDYGPWDAGEETDMFAEVADLIIEKQRAVEVT